MFDRVANILFGYSQTIVVARGVRSAVARTMLYRSPSVRYADGCKTVFVFDRSRDVQAEAGATFVILSNVALIGGMIVCSFF